MKLMFSVQYSKQSRMTERLSNGIEIECDENMSVLDRHTMLYQEICQQHNNNKAFTNVVGKILTLDEVIIVSIIRLN